ncbi:hypothetical protein CR156_14925 [Stenotrophomonas lactitubi]|uniref:hypothetical protein n=1 Tax=Stenotrophomonas TaxID=40323 RepID=UPI000C27B73D|nr:MULTISPECIES: hypothetical protein [Stenotrophomonas]MBA0250499.1 hypothetical protein [Stenotrophomonas maltophilia]MBA0320011.1 hypothetical protein [Stenotrophomonas maltophilia]PJO53375.1 hypothetical protein CR156_14925 [Stenotrophomonas lactitubi]
MTVGTFLFLLVLSAAVLVAIGTSRAFQSRSQREAFGRDFERSYYGAPGGLAMSVERSRLKIRARNAVKIYPLADVRSWEKHWHNSKRQGTLIVSVRDTDHPVWSIPFQSENEMNQWYEVLNQAINEGGKP